MMQPGYVLAWLQAFLFTQLIEVPLYCLGLRVGVIAAAGASAITHPILWFVIFPFLPLSYWWLVMVGELFAWSAEALYFRVALRRPRAWLWSLVANGASFGLGVLSRRLFGGP